MPLFKEKVSVSQTSIVTWNDNFQRVVETIFIQGYTREEILSHVGSDPSFHGRTQEEVESRLHQVARAHAKIARDMTPKRADNEILRMIRMEEEALRRLQKVIDAQTLAYERWMDTKEGPEPDYPTRFMEQARKSRAFIATSWQSIKRDRYQRAAFDTATKAEKERARIFAGIPSSGDRAALPEEKSVEAHHREAIFSLMERWQDTPNPLTPSLRSDLSKAISSDFTLLDTGG